MVKLRTYVYIDSLQPQLAEYMASVLSNNMNDIKQVTFFILFSRIATKFNFIST